MKPRLLVNENFPKASILKLRKTGYDVVAVAEKSPGLLDDAVLDWAVRESRWLVTFDRDYGELVFSRRRQAPPAVLYLRITDPSPEEPADLLLSLLQMPEDLLGRFVVVERDGIRKRALISSV